jgi:HEPN domain-containing protein
MKKLTRAWVRKAEADLRMAQTLSRAADPEHDGVCFHCQQSAEKFLKALLQELGLVIPRTHALEDLLTLIAPHQTSLKSLRRGLLFLTSFAVEVRYPGKNATKRQAEAALRWADRVASATRSLLGIPPPTRRRK